MNSAMEIETVVRAQVPILILVINNNGIYHGLDSDSYAKTPISQLPSTALIPDLRYDLIADALGGKGYFVRTPKELGDALEETINDENGNSCIVINVMIEPGVKDKLVNNCEICYFCCCYCYFYFERKKIFVEYLSSFGKKKK